MKKKKYIIAILSILAIASLSGCGDNATNGGSDSQVENESESKNTPDYPDSIDGVDIHFENTVIDDVTGNWRLSRVSTVEDLNSYALDYYKHYFASDDEIHWVVNFSTKTTSKITYVLGSLDVTTYEYVDKEELSAKTLGSGSLLTEYSINVDNGEIEQLQ